MDSHAFFGLAVIVFLSTRGKQITKLAHPDCINAPNLICLKLMQCELLVLLVICFKIVMFEEPSI